MWRASARLPIFSSVITRFFTEHFLGAWALYPEVALTSRQLGSVLLMVRISQMGKLRLKEAEPLLRVTQLNEA